MGKVWISSDLHFNHNRDFIYSARGFENVWDMNRALIENWNSRVDVNDDVYVLGDLCLGDLEEGRKCIAQLKGNISIVRGNHDTNNRIEMYRNLWNVKEVAAALYVDYRKYHFYLSHYPTLCSNLDNKKLLRQRTINLCGHVHTKDAFSDWVKYDSPIVHCEVDAWNCAPVELDEIIELMKKKFGGENE